MIEFSNLKEMPQHLVKLQSELNNPKNTKQVDMKLKSGRSLSYGYVELGELISALREPMAKNGFSVIQSPYNDNDILGVETMLLHESGEYIKGKFGSRFNGNNAQDVGSQITYYRRYSLLNMLNLAQDDDDAIKASKDKFAPKNAKPSEKQLNAMYYKVKDNNCDMHMFNTVIKPNITMDQYKWLMDNFNAYNFDIAVKSIKEK